MYARFRLLRRSFFGVSSGLSLLSNFFAGGIVGFGSDSRNGLSLLLFGLSFCLGFSASLVCSWRFFFGSVSEEGLVVRLVKLSLCNFINVFSTFIRFIIS